MAKFSGGVVKTAVRSPVATTNRTVTYEGGAGFARDAKSDLFVLACANMVGEDTFYESAGERDARFNLLVRQVASEDPEWIQRFIPWLRSEAFMRSTPVVAIAECAQVGLPVRGLISATLKRADEPAELLGYWLTNYGRKIPQSIKRGIADSVNRLYTERSALRYDGQSRGIRMADVIELTHPKPKAEWQSELYKWLLDIRHRGGAEPGESLQVLRKAAELEAMPVADRRKFMDTPGAVETLNQAGFSWERLSGWLQGPMDAKAWETIIPSMGYMALLRNLRNFEQAGISDEVAFQVTDRLADPEQVAKSMQFPMRFYSAWKNATDLQWAQTLERALDLSCGNIPELKGKTLVVTDVSGSMSSSLSARGTLMRYEVAAVFAGAMAKRNKTDVVCYGAYNAKLPVGRSVLRTVDNIRHVVGTGQLGHATYGHTAIAQHWNGHDRVVIFTDDQQHDSGRVQLPDVPIYTFNVGGYARSSLDSGLGKNHTFAGFSDRCFTLLKIMEDRKDGSWPF